MCGIATIMPGTSAVESVFSVLKFIQNNYQNNLRNISLEGMVNSNP